ncbi:MAG: 4-(cytidine 5'-diphospho)-2-C-methyl-D-erythritol kinase [bacterium]|nr:4-(cytidine 5'-diphospho)-2-C-methyl-D-erythritol kinase [bacterium]
MNVRAPAKVNLRLEVHSRRADGFHEIRSVVAAVGLFDVLRFEEARPGSLELGCSNSGLACDERNLVLQAARRLARESGSKSGVRIELEKAIPIAAGLGGGSSDAAATLWALNRMWQTGLGGADLACLGADIGSDVPLFFSLPTAVVQGRGEKVRPAELRWTGWTVLVFGDQPVSTAEVYRAWQPEDSRPGTSDEIEQVLDAADAATLAKLCCNDLEAAVFRVCPAMERMFQRVERAGIGPIRVSGAGSTLFALFDERETAEDAARELEQQGFGTVVAGVGRNAQIDQPG